MMTMVLAASCIIHNYLFLRRPVVQIAELYDGRMGQSTSWNRERMCPRHDSTELLYMKHIRFRIYIQTLLMYILERNIVNPRIPGRDPYYLSISWLDSEVAKVYHGGLFCCCL